MIVEAVVKWGRVVISAGKVANFPKVGNFASLPEALLEVVRPFLAHSKTATQAFAASPVRAGDIILKVTL